VIFAEPDVTPPTVLQLWGMIVAITVVGGAYLTAKKIFFPERKHEDQFVTRREIEEIRAMIAECGSGRSQAELKLEVRNLPDKFASKEDLRRMEVLSSSFATRGDLQNIANQLDKVEAHSAKLGDTMQVLYTKVEAQSVRYEGLAELVTKMQNELTESGRLLASIHEGLMRLLRDADKRGVA
jgi:hypothetical protein